ncbi:uncharacterized protein PAC_03902 [Phialocephala subalpina]|uniref:Zn(2)-C6 fungal-type domain-containing protein n=1 Tax=Phialocephala subalpina TaxID=576137 RepID=A0A1L7WML7_9HELO|nr:uncharacterized protein PAC_03902 [Phialocephala subalpina]
MSTSDARNRQAIAFQDAVNFIKQNPSHFDIVFFHRNEQERDLWGQKLESFEELYDVIEFPKEGDRVFCRDYYVQFLFLFLNGPNRNNPLPPPKPILRLKELLETVVTNQTKTQGSKTASKHGQQVITERHAEHAEREDRGASASEPFNDEAPQPKPNHRSRPSRSALNGQSSRTSTSLSNPMPITSINTTNSVPPLTTTQPMTSVTNQPQAPARVAPRQCQECRRKHRKCDRALPACGLCSRNNHVCLYEGSVNEARAAPYPGTHRSRPDARA